MFSFTPSHVIPIPVPPPKAIWYFYTLLLNYQYWCYVLGVILIKFCGLVARVEKKIHCSLLQNMGAIINLWCRQWLGLETMRVSPCWQPRPRLVRAPAWALRGPCSLSSCATLCVSLTLGVSCRMLLAASKLRTNSKYLKK